MSKKNVIVLRNTAQHVSLSHRKVTEENNQRAREPITRSRGKVRGQFPSTKMNRMVAWESQLERRACYLFEFSPCIKSFREQPIQLRIPHINKLCRYTPDFELIWHTGEISYVEIKPESQLTNELVNYFNDIDTIIQSSGYSFIVITDKELNHPIREDNLLLLRIYQQPELSEFCLASLRRFFHTHSKDDCLFSELVSLTGSLSSTYTLLAQGFVTTDLNTALSNDSLLQVQKDIDYENCLFTYRTAPNFR